MLLFDMRELTRPRFRSSDVALLAQLGAGGDLAFEKLQPFVLQLQLMRNCESSVSSPLVRAINRSRSDSVRRSSSLMFLASCCCCAVSVSRRA